MARRTGFLHEVSTAPWWFSLLTGVVGGLLILFAGPVVLAQLPGTVGAGIATGLTPIIAPLAIGFFLLCALGAGRSFTAARHRARLLRTHTQVEQLRTMPWPDFERLTGEAFRHQGYRVTEAGLGGADGGVDLVLERDGKRALVQCKRWSQRSVGVATVRELAGVLAHDHSADSAILVTTSTFTLEARSFADKSGLTLIDGEQLLAMTGEPPGNGSVAPDLVVAEPEPAQTDTPPCPRCGSPTVIRTAKATGQTFLGCSTFPRCRGTLPIHPTPAA